MEFRQITKNIHYIISQCYIDCKRTCDLHNDFSGYNANDCADDVCEKLKSLESYDFYKIEKDHDLVGYVGFTNMGEYRMLYTFFIRPKYRNRDNLSEFWTKTVNMLPEEFVAGIFTSNEPARRFLLRNGGIEINKDNVSYFKFRR